MANLSHSQLGEDKKGCPNFTGKRNATGALDTSLTLATRNTTTWNIGFKKKHAEFNKKKHGGQILTDQTRGVQRWNRGGGQAKCNGYTRYLSVGDEAMAPGKDTVALKVIKKG